MKPDATSPFIERGASPVAAGASTAQPTDLDLSFLGPSMGDGELGWLAHYRVNRILGTGGMGVVFEADDTQLHRPVALKVMRKELAANAVTRERFLKEARAAAALNSDFIVTVYQVGLSNDVPYLSMQFLRGESVQDRLERKQRLPIGEALAITKQTAMGLADAHAIGMVHRDIKPANLWLETDGPGDAFKRVRILDFGLARRDSESTRLTATGVVVGTPHFMAPEQASGKPVDGRADLFSLGGVLYSMLTGELAFDGDSVMAVLTALATKKPPQLVDRCPGIPKNVSNLVDRMLEKDPQRRIATATDVVAAINAIQREHPDLNYVPSLSGTLKPIGDVNTNVDGGTTATAISDKRHKTLSGMLTSTVQDLIPLNGHRKSWLAGMIAGAGILAVGLGLFALYMLKRPDPAQAPIAATGEPIIVGVLHSQTGTMALSESAVADATMLAIEEINEAGGLLNRPIKPIIADGESDPATFASLANQMLTKDGAQAIFGCWTSASRKTVKPVVERFDGLLFYPVQYEGLEQSPRIVYFGSAPNQQLLPAVDFLIDKLGKKKLFLVGSDYVFPRAAHAIIRDRVAQRGGAEIVGESLIPMGERNVSTAIESIRRSKPDAIINTINGSTNVFFFKELRAAGIKSAEVPTLSVSISENFLKGLDVSAMSNDYLVAAYFHSVENAAGKEFTSRFQKRFGDDRVATDAMVSAYSAVHIWAQAVKAAGATDASTVVKNVRGQKFSSPLGEITVDAENQHVWQPVWIGRIRPDGQVDIAGGSAECLRPDPWPETRTRQVWERFLNDLYVGWDGRWQPRPNQ